MTEKQTNIDVEIVENVRGGRCPLPMLRAKRALNQIQTGQIVQVISTDPNSHQDFELMLKHLPHQLIEFQTLPAEIDNFDKEFHFYIEKGES